MCSALPAPQAFSAVQSQVSAGTAVAGWAGLGSGKIDMGVTCTLLAERALSLTASVGERLALINPKVQDGTLLDYESFSHELLKKRMV